MPITASHLPSLLKVLADPVRLRILGLLELEELSVGELSRALGMAQSRVSNHLRVLREQELLAERHAGTSTFLRPALRADACGNVSARHPYVLRCLIHHFLCDGTLTPAAATFFRRSVASSRRETALRLRRTGRALSFFARPS